MNEFVLFLRINAEKIPAANKTKMKGVKTELNVKEIELKLLPKTTKSSGKK